MSGTHEDKVGGKHTLMASEKIRCRIDHQDAIHHIDFVAVLGREDKFCWPLHVLLLNLSAKTGPPAGFWIQVAPLE